MSAAERMEHRTFDRAKREAGVVGLGAWQFGGDWGEVGDEQAHGVLGAALSSGVDFIDTADVYGDGRSEQLIGGYLAGRGDGGRRGPVLVATKMGRRVEQRPDNYTRDNFRAWTDRSRANLQVESLDLVQLHCPPDPVYRDDAVYAALDELAAEGRVSAYGFSVETCDQALQAIRHPGVASIQIILNCFRLKPLDEVLPAAREAGVGIIARVPLASGLLSGKYDEQTTFPESDHRNYNRHGEAFDVGETFAGVPFEVGLSAVRELREAVPGGMSMAQFALRWVIDQPGVTVVIPGARNAEQAQANAAVARLAPLSDEAHAAVREVYDRHIRQHVHDRW